MTRLALAYLLAVGLFLLPLACAKRVPFPVEPVEDPCSLPDCQVATCEPPTCYADPKPPGMP